LVCSPVSIWNKTFEFFSTDWRGCQVLSMPHLFSELFWKCKVLLCSPCIININFEILLGGGGVFWYSYASSKMYKYHKTGLVTSAPLFSMNSVSRVLLVKLSH
jgi:hypothetical protein